MTEDPTATDRIRLITERLQAALTPQVLHIIDESKDHVGHAGATGGGHFKIHLVSSHFTDRSAIERHKMIYRALGDALGNEIHAVSINAKTPAEAAIHNASS